MDPKPLERYSQPDAHYLIAIGFPGDPVAPLRRKRQNTNANSDTFRSASFDRSQAPMSSVSDDILLFQKVQAHP